MLITLFSAVNKWREKSISIVVVVMIVLVNALAGCVPVVDIVQDIAFT